MYVIVSFIYDILVGQTIRPGSVPVWRHQNVRVFMCTGHLNNRLIIVYRSWLWYRPNEVDYDMLRLLGCILGNATACDISCDNIKQSRPYTSQEIRRFVVVSRCWLKTVPVGSYQVWRNKCALMSTRSGGTLSRCSDIGKEDELLVLQIPLLVDTGFDHRWFQNVRLNAQRLCYPAHLFYSYSTIAAFQQDLVVYS